MNIQRRICSDDMYPLLMDKTVRRVHITEDAPFCMLCFRQSWFTSVRMNLIMAMAVICVTKIVLKG